MAEDRKKKLLVTASTFPRWEGDTEPRFVLDLASYMTKEYDVTVLVPAAPAARDREVLEGVHVIRYHYFPIHKWETLCYPGAIVPRIKEKKIRVLLVPFLLLSLYFHVLKLIHNYDIVHAHWLIPQGIVQSLFKKPYVVTGHGGDVTSLNKGILCKLKIRCIKQASAVTVVSEHLKGKIQELVQGINVAVIPMGVDVEKFGQKYYVSNYFKQGDKKVVLFVGRLAEKKGVSYLIEAMRKVDAMLAIVGDGPLRADLEKLALDMGEKVVFLGAKTHEELKTIYASAHVFICPSITAGDGDQEGVPTTIMEAMASGLPVVASRSGGIAEVVKNGVNGLLCEERDTDALSTRINEILHNEQLRKNLANNANSMVQQYSYARSSQLYREIYQSV